MELSVSNLLEKINEDRPKSSERTRKTYKIYLTKLQQICNADTDKEDCEFLKNPKVVMNELKLAKWGKTHTPTTLSYISQRNYLNTIIVTLYAINDDEKYNDIILEYTKQRDLFNKQYEDEQTTGYISDKQAPNFAKKEEVEEMMKTMNKELTELKKTKVEDWRKKDHALLQVYTLFSIHSRIPLRNDLAFAETINKRAYNKLSDEDKEKKNYLVWVNGGKKMFFVLNDYKTSKKYRELIINIEDKELLAILRYYVGINGMGVLFKSRTGNPITRQKITQILTAASQKHMNKKISTTMLRKIYDSSKYAHILDEMKKDASIMGHSIETAQKVYIKKDQPVSSDDASP